MLAAVSRTITLVFTFAHDTPIPNESHRAIWHINCTSTWGASHGTSGHTRITRENWTCRRHFAAGPRYGPGIVRAWQWKQSPQSKEPPCGRYSEPRLNRNDIDRPAYGGGRRYRHSNRGAAFRYPAFGTPAGWGHRLDWPAAGFKGSGSRLFRRQYGRGGSFGRGRRTSKERAGNSIPRRPAGPGPHRAEVCPGADAVHRRRTRHGRPEP